MRQVITLLLALSLALWLIWGFWPLAHASRLAFSLLTLSLAVLAGWRYARRGPATASPLAEQALPPPQYAGAVVLVCGGSEPLFPAGQAYRETPAGWYIAVRQPQQLETLAGLFAAARPALVCRLSVLLAVIPEQWQQADDLTGQLLEWQRAVARCRPALGERPPVWLCSWLNGPQPDNGYCWYALTGSEQEMQVLPQGAVPQAWPAWCAGRDPAASLPRLSHSLWLQAALCWLQPRVLAVLGARCHDTPALPPCMLAVCCGPVAAVADNLWRQHLTALTTLPARDAIADGPPLPLPDALLALLPARNGVSPRMQYWRRVGAIVGLFLLLAIAASYLNNQRLIRNVSDHLDRYQHLREPVAKAQAQQPLRRDVALLEAWRRNGEPLRYGLGLYQGLRLIAPLRAAIDGWAAPVPPQPAPVPGRQVEVPTTLRLDSLSLFDSGKAVLKAGSERVLVGALMGIQARPGRLIVISGHTDNTGNPALNQALSLKRADAVRDWMRDTGDVPESCFAVQGYGASRPAAPNDTAAGRALNRRVEISLVPQADACRLPGTTLTSSQEDDVLHHPKEK